MAGDDLFKRYLEIGASVLGMSRERAERIVADLVASGEVAKGQATKAADWLVERGKTGSEEIAELVRREIRQQIAALGLATRDDIARLEAQIDELRTPAAPAATTAPPKPRARAAGKAAAGVTKPAGITKSAPRTRPRPASSPEPGDAPPAGGADHAKG
jgi:polyhydroxyalkanoate synthesis regulator phasin